MSILGLLKRSSQLGGASLAPPANSGQTRLDNQQSNFTTGDATQLGGRADSNLVGLRSGYTSTAPVTYIAATFQDRLARRNQVVDYKAKTYIRPGNFQGTIGTCVS